MGSQAGKSREGALSSTAFPGLIYSILSEKSTGVLTLSDEKSEKSVYITSGRPVFATSNDRDDRLDQVIFKAGLVSLDGLVRAVERSTKEKKRLGTVLVEMNLIHAHDLFEGLSTQVKNIICSLFLWTEGRYRYVTGPLPSGEVITLKLSTGNLILEGMRRIESWDRIWLAVGRPDIQYQTAGGTDDMARDLQLTRDEWTLLSDCEQPTSLRDLCRVSKIRDFEICRLVWALLTLGILKRVAVAP